MSQAFITTSWDDGHPADLRVAEMLEKHSLRGTFYIPRSISSGVMSSSQLADVASKFEIGAHTLNHVFLADADDATARSEIAGSKAWVEDATGKPCPMFCPPAGRFKPHHLPMFKQAGFTGIRTVEFMSLDRPRKRDGLWEMPTTLQAFPQPISSYLKNLAKRLAGRNLWHYIVHGHSRDWTILARRLLERAVRSGGVFHLWGHSWELEQAAQWQRLSDVLALMGNHSSSATCLTNGELCAAISSAPAPK